MQVNIPYFSGGTTIHLITVSFGRAHAPVGWFNGVNVAVNDVVNDYGIYDLRAFA